MNNFRDNITGRLLWAEADQNTRFKYTIWFDYTRRLVNDLHEGDLVAVPNFATGPSGIRYSILQLVTVMPMHYALGTDIKDLKGYPGFVMQAAKSASADWTEQETESYEDTTKIICEAIPTNLECNESGDVKLEMSMAMVGKDVQALTSEMTGLIFNREIDKDVETVIEIGDLIRDKDINIYIRVDDLIKTHFGVFGFTGVGKSNLTSTLVSNLLSVDEPIKIILFDLMDEYTGLLADQILTHNGKIICLSEKTLMKHVFDYLNSNFEDNYKEIAVNKFVDTLLLPKGLKTKDNVHKLKKSAPSILRKFKLLKREILRVEKFINEIKIELFQGSIGVNTKNEIETALKTIFKSHMSEKLTPQLAKSLIEKHFEPKEFGTSPITAKLKETAQTRVGIIKRKLQEIAESDEEEINPKIQISIIDILKELDDKSTSTLYLITSHDTDKIREFASKLGWNLFEYRRKNGRFTPLVCFIFDEADEFMPGETYMPKNESYKQSRKIIETLARRGRKFGLGVGIATQRSAYLDTKTIGQLHTYFISKLPRKNDRETVASAFGLSEDQFTQTFKFQKGQWLLVSHDATGIDMPIPIQAPNAEERIKKFLEGYTE